MTVTNLLLTAVATLGQWFLAAATSSDADGGMTAILTACAVGLLSVMSLRMIVNTMMHRLTFGILGSNRNNINNNVITSWPSWLLWVVLVGGLFVIYHHFALFLWFVIIWFILIHGLDYTPPSPNENVTGFAIVLTATLFLAWLLRKSQNVLGIGKFVEQTFDTMLLSFWHAIYEIGRFVLFTTPKTILETVWQVARALTRSLVFIVGMLLPISASRRLAVLDVESDDDDDDYEYESESDEPLDEDDYEVEDVFFLKEKNMMKQKRTHDGFHTGDVDTNSCGDDQSDDTHSCTDNNSKDNYEEAISHESRRNNDDDGYSSSEQ